MSAIYNDLKFIKPRESACKKPTPRPPAISKEDMAIVFEKLEAGEPIKSIAMDFEVHYVTLTRWIERAEISGYGAWAQYEEET